MVAVDPDSGMVVTKVRVDMDVQSLSTSPDGAVLYAVGSDEAEDHPLAVDELDAHTGRLLAREVENDSAGGGQGVATDEGVWVSFRTGMNGVTVLYRKTTLRTMTAPDAELSVTVRPGHG